MTDYDRNSAFEENRWDKIEPIPVKLSMWNPFTLLLACLVVGVGTALLFNFVVTPYFKSQSAKEDLSNVAAQRGNLIAVNNTAVTFQGQRIETATLDQLALSSGATQEPGAVFIFGNSKPGEKKTVEVFVDFKSQRSRDFMLINHNALKNMIENGLIELRVIPVPTGNAYGVYAAEAVAETFVSNPDKAWTVMFELLRQGSAVDADDANLVAERVAEVVKSVTKNDDVTDKTIQSGAFSGWIMAAAKDRRLASGFSPPMVYVNGEVVDPNEVNLNSPEEFREAVVNNQGSSG